MSAATDTEADVLGALDFTPSLPCEHSRHGSHHLSDGPATHIANFRCVACPHHSGDYLICSEGVRRFVQLGLVRCVKCKHVTQCSETLTISPLESS